MNLYLYVSQYKTMLTVHFHGIKRFLLIFQKFSRLSSTTTTTFDLTSRKRIFFSKSKHLCIRVQGVLK